jgi:2-polyprenyl-6-hydroxyphenyl methylase/3-demethylubiquinone-9 3-methyltransferase
VNNAVYDQLGERWYAADDDPIALLRAESRARNPWIAATLLAQRGRGAKVLDVGCGGGFVANDLAAGGFDVTGLDASTESLRIAAGHDRTGRVRYQVGDALALPYPDGSFDAVCAMDFLEHVGEPARVIAEAGRVLRRGGLFFFHTFNRNLLAWLVAVKGVAWFVKNTPRDLHALSGFIKPAELRAMCESAGLATREVRGLAPAFLSSAFWRMLATGIVPRDFTFKFTGGTAIGYTGYAERG